jgi:hypothetical protein
MEEVLVAKGVRPQQFDDYHRWEVAIVEGFSWMSGLSDCIAKCKLLKIGICTRDCSLTIKVGDTPPDSTTIVVSC